MKKKDLILKIQGLDEETQKRVICAVVGHSKIQTHCFGYYNCARCGEQVGDTLAGVYDPSDAVVVGHNCDQCHVNFDKLDWKHKFMTPDPFETDGK